MQLTTEKLIWYRGLTYNLSQNIKHTLIISLHTSHKVVKHSRLSFDTTHKIDSVDYNIQNDIEIVTNYLMAIGG